MENVIGLFIVAASFLFSAVLVVAAFTAADIGMDAAKDAVAGAQKAISVEDVDFNRVKSNNISGIEVVQLIQKFDDSGYGHLVVTTGKPDGFYSADGITDTHSDNYISPEKKFSGSVVTDKNDVVYAVRFIENGSGSVEFDIKKASSEPKSIDSMIKDAQYSLFTKFLTNRVKCNKYMQLCSQWGEAVGQLNSAKLRNIYSKYAKDDTNQEEYIASQILVFDSQIRFYEAVTAEVKLWTENKWWEAVLSADLNNSSEPLEPDGEEPEDSGSPPWWDDTGNPEGDNKVDESDSDSDSSSNDGNNTGDDQVIEFTPEPSVSDRTPEPGAPSESESPEQTSEPGAPDETDVPSGTELPDPEESCSPEPDSGTVPIVGPESS